MNRTIRVLASGRAQALTPLYYDIDGFIASDQDADETMNYTVDWSGWLGADTISSSTWTAENVTLGSAANTAKQTSMRISGVTGSGKAVNRVTTAAAAVKDLTIRFKEAEA